MRKLLLFCFAIFQFSVGYCDTAVIIDGISYILTPPKVGTAKVTYNHTNSSIRYVGSIVIPETVEYEGNTYRVTGIGSSAFSLCNKLASIEIPNTITTIEDYAFEDCSGLSEVKINSLKSWCEISFNSNPLYYATHLIVNGEEITDIEFKDDISSIGNSAFYGFKGLKSIKIGKSVKSISSYAFYKCSSLTSVIMEEGIDSIGQNVFQDCSNLCTIELANSITTIGKYTFSGCKSLSNLIFPDNINVVNNGLCENCTALKSIVIPKNILAIGYYSFKGCNKLEKIYISESLLGIGLNAFGECENISDVYCYATTPPIPVDGYYWASYNFFYGSYVGYSTLHVPESSIEDYKKAFSWKDFGNIVALTIDETSIDTPKADNKSKEYFSLGGIKLPKARKGINIVKMGNGQTKKIIVK